MKVKAPPRLEQKRFKDVAEGNVVELTNGYHYLKVTTFTAATMTGYDTVNVIKLNTTHMDKAHFFISGNTPVVAEYDTLTLSNEVTP